MSIESLLSALSPPGARQRPKGVRSRVSNNKTLFLPGTDGRSAEARRFRDVYFDIADGLGGVENLNEAQRQIARRIALLSIACERIERDAMNGGPIDDAAYGMLCDRLGRALARLGLKPTKKLVFKSEFPTATKIIA